MIVVACALGSAAAVVGLYVGYHSEISSGGMIVLISAAGFFVAWLLAPRHGIIPELLGRRSQALLRSKPEAEAEVILASPEILSPHAS